MDRSQRSFPSWAYIPLISATLALTSIPGCSGESPISPEKQAEGRKSKADVLKGISSAGTPDNALSKPRSKRKTVSASDTF